MSRVTPGASIDLGLEDDQVYQGLLLSAKLAKSDKKASDGKPFPDQVVVEWELRQGVKLRDYIGISLGLQAATKQPSKLRQLLNALAEKPKDADVWFDGETLEWGYDLESINSPAYAVLTPGMVVQFKGEKRKGNDGNERYKITGYKTAGKTKRKAVDSVPVDVDPDEIPF